MVVTRLSSNYCMILYEVRMAIAFPRKLIIHQENSSTKLGAVRLI